MARTVAKPLKMADGTYVRTSIEELREHFDLPSVLGYYADGKLKEWLENRYYKDEAGQLSRLDPNADDFNMRLCELLGVVCPDDTDANMDEIAARNAKLTQLKQFTDSDEIIQNADKVAFTQEEMTGLVDEGASLIYLCGERFSVVQDMENVVFIGINSPVVHFSDENPYDLTARNITFKDVVFDGNHRKIWYEATRKKVLERKRWDTKSLYEYNSVTERISYDGWHYFINDEFRDGMCTYWTLYKQKNGQNDAIALCKISSEYFFIDNDNDCIYLWTYRECHNGGVEMVLTKVNMDGEFLAYTNVMPYGDGSPSTNEVFFVYEDWFYYRKIYGDICKMELSNANEGKCIVLFGKSPYHFEPSIKFFRIIAGYLYICYDSYGVYWSGQKTITAKYTLDGEFVEELEAVEKGGQL